MKNLLSILQFESPLNSTEKKWMDKAILYLRGGNKSQIEYAYLIYSLVYNLEPKNILEIGTARGFSAAVIAKALHDCGAENSKVVSHDIHNPEDKKNWHANKLGNVDPFKGKILSLIEIWSKFDKSNTLRNKIEFRSNSLKESISKLDNKIDFVFIDGDHTYEGVKNDFEMIESSLSPNAIILFDDYFHELVRHQI